MPKTQFIVLTYLARLRTPSQQQQFLRWLSAEFPRSDHEVVELAKDLIGRKRPAKQHARCQQSTKKTRNQLVEKCRLHLAMETLRQQPEQVDHLVIKGLAAEEMDLELYHYLKAARKRLEKKERKERLDLQYAYEWRIWEQYYLVKYPPPDRQKASIHSHLIDDWKAWFQLELLQVISQYVQIDIPDPVLKEIFAQLPTAPTESHSALQLYRLLKKLWAYPPQQGVFSADLENETIRTLKETIQETGPLLASNLYIHTLFYFLNKSHCVLDRDNLLRLTQLYHWGRDFQLHGLNRVFLRIVSNTYFSLAFLAATSEEKDQYLAELASFLDNFPNRIPPKLMAQYQQYLHLNRAFLSAEYARVLPLAQQIDFQDPYYETAIQFLQNQALYELGEYDFVKIRLEKQKKAKLKKKQLGRTGRQIETRRIDLFIQLLKTDRKADLLTLAKEIQKPHPLAGRAWLLQKVQHKLN